MPDKSVSLSVRLTANDAAFLAGFNPPGATTLSEKVRTIIAEARRRRAGSERYADNLYFMEELLSSAMHRLRETEAEKDMHSELMLALGHWLPDAMASLMSGVPPSDSEHSAEELKKLEAVMADRVFALIEQVLRLAVTGRSPCYDPAVVTDRASEVIRLAEFIKQSSTQEQEP